MFCPANAPCSASDEARNFVGGINISKAAESTTFNFDASRALSPSSNGTQTIQDQFSVYILRTMTARLSGSAGAIFSSSSAVADLGRQDQDYYNVNASLSWKLTPTLSVYGKYSYISADDGGEFKPGQQRYSLFRRQLSGRRMAAVTGPRAHAAHPG